MILAASLLALLSAAAGQEAVDAGAAPPHTHPDLWRSAAAAWGAGFTQVKWVKAHLTEDQARRRGFMRDDWH